jgi:hypothetical protein
MTRQANELPYRHDSTDYTERTFDKPDRDLEIFDDALLTTEYIILEWAILFVDQIFLDFPLRRFLFVELGN